MATQKHVKSRLLALGRNRAWLAENTRYSVSTINHALSPLGHGRKKVLERISMALDAEKTRQESEAVRAALKGGDK